LHITHRTHNSQRIATGRRPTRRRHRRRRTDPDGYENVNIVATAAKPLISALSAQLRAAFAIV